MVLLGLAGCADTSTWVGTWEGRRTSAPASADPVIAETLALVRLTIKPDGTFDLLDGGFTASGEASLGRARSQLVVRKVLGSAATLPFDRKNLNIALERRPDGSILLSGSAFGVGPVRLQRGSQPTPTPDRKRSETP